MKPITIVLFLLIGLNSIAQTPKDADNAFGNQQWQQAQKSYLQHLSSLNAQQLQNLAVTYLKTTPGKPDFNNAVVYLKQSSDKGDFKSMLYLHEIYRDGLNGTKDTVQGFEWLQKSAATGSSYSNRLLGLAYYNGKGTKKNVSLAISFLRTAADNYDPEAKYFLAKVYEETGDFANARIWYEKDENKIESMIKAGNLYSSGKGGPANTGKALLAYYAALRKIERASDRRVDAIVDSLFNFQFAPQVQVKTILDRLIREMQSGFASQRGAVIPQPVFGKPISSTGIDMDKFSATLTFYEYKEPGPFLFQSIRHLKSSSVPNDANCWLFAGIPGQGYTEPEDAEMAFDLWAEDIRSAYPAYRHSDERVLSATQGLKKSLTSVGIANGKEVFINLKLRSFSGVYYLELIVKDRRYHRTD